MTTHTASHEDTAAQETITGQSAAQWHEELRTYLMQPSAYSIAQVNEDNGQALVTLRLSDSNAPVVRRMLTSLPKQEPRDSPQDKDEDEDEEGEKKGKKHH